MTEQEMERLRYPVGRFEPAAAFEAHDRADAIQEIAALPGRLRKVVEPLSDDQLDTPYRPDGWTLRQVVHHVPDSHLNGYVRLKRTVTEERPTLCTYDQSAWGRMADARSGPVEPSLDLLASLHERWTEWMKSLDPDDWDAEFVHPESGSGRLDLLLQLYAWHGRHHLAHVTGLLDRRGWRTS